MDLRTATTTPSEPTAPTTLTIKTTRRGRHHIMRAAVVGRGSKTVVVPFLVDTGASTVALPASMTKTLGFRPGDLEDGLVETANGRIRVKKGRLASVEIGGPDDADVIRNVDVVFVADSALGYPLLGMNVLGRYRVTIDDDHDHILLDRKR